MSADGQGDSVSLNTEENSSANNETAANKTNLQVLEGSSSPSKVDSEQITTPVTISSASNPELQTVDDIETEQTLKPTEKEKALHVDNELDFELKWDDDGQGDSVSLNIEENSPANNDLEGSSSVPKVDSEQITSSVTILGSASNLELQTVNDIETEQTLKLTEKEKALDVNSELDFELKWDDDNELIPDDESKMDTDPVPNNEPDKPEISNEEANEQETNGEPCNTEKQVEDTTNEQVAGKDDDEGDLLNTADEEKILDNVNTENEDKVLDTNLKIDLASKVSPVESDTNSLDEHLVYSDVEAPEIEEKDLLDELDAHISPNNSNDEKLEIKIETPEILPKTGENSKKSSPQHIFDSTAMDVDDLILLPVKKEEIPDVNDTLSSNTEMETSTYEVNNEHGLTKPDVMIEIPTQEYIEDFDDSGELSEEGEQYDEDILLNNDSNDIQKLLSDNRKVTSPIRDENRISVEKPVSGKPEDSSDKTKDKSKNVATEESHADIILEATNSEPKLTTIVQEHTADSKSTIDDEVQTTAEPKLMTNDEELKADSKSTKDDDAQPTAGPKLPTNNDEKLAAEPDDAEPIDEPKVITNDKVQPADDDMHPTAEPKSTMDDDVLPTAVTKVEEISFSTPFEATKEVDNCPGESGPNTIEAEDVSHSAELGASSPISELPKVSEAHDTSTYLEKTQGTEAKDGSSSDKLETKKLSDDKNVSSSEVVRPTEVAEPEIPSSTAEPKEASGKTDSAIEAQPSTSKYSLQELSDEDQEVTDSLGLLAESSRVMDDDDEQEQEHEDEDDDDDFDQDDESNQMTAEHSEDSNAQQSETDAPRESMEVEESPTTDKEEFQFPAEVEDTTGVAEALGDTAQAEEITDADVSETEKAVQALLGAETAEEPANDVSQDDASDDKQSDDMECVETEGASKLRQLLLKDKEPDSELPGEKKSPSKVKKLEITKPSNEINIVDLGGSSSEDDIQEVKKRAPPSPDARGVTSVNIPDAVEVMAAAAGCMSRMRRGSGELVISGVPRPPPHKPARLNTSEVSIKTVATEPIPLPDASASAQDGPAALKFGLEVFSLDSDDDDKQADQTPKKMTAIELDRVRQNKQCVNMYCTSDSTTPLLPCDARCAAYYGARRGAVCRTCALTVAGRTQSIIEGVREFAPLLSLDMGQTREELVEISDSDSEDEAEIAPEPESALGELGAKFLDENLADMFNATWNKFKLDDRLREAQDELDVLVNKMEGECTEIDAMLGECQQATDQLRRALYDSFAHERQELPAILIYDTPPNTWSGLEDGILAYENNKEIRQSKRRMAAATEPPAKRPAIPLGYAPLDSDASTAQNQPKPTASATEVPGQVEDDSGDISVVRLSAEAAPAGLPPPGQAARAPLRPGAAVFAMRNAYGTWHKAKIIDVQPKGNNQFTMCKVKFEHKVKNPCKLLPARCLAYDQPSEVRMTIGTRVIALFKDPNNSKAESYYSGIVAEIPNPVNNYRYLVFFDDGYAQYVSHGATRLVCECAKLVWDEVHPFSRQFVRDYLRAYPERPMVRAHAGQSLKTEWNGKWWVSRVVKVDASLVQVHFEEDDRYEWIYRGSTRLAPLYLELQAAERQRARPLPRAQPGRRFNMPYVEYTRSDEPAAVPASTPQQIEQEIRRQRAVAKKSTALPPAPAPAPAPTPLDGVTSRVVFYTPKNAIRPLKMKAHTCGPHCKRTDVLALKDLRTYNPLTKPLLSGWERQIVKYRWTRSVMYRAPCGRRIRDYPELHHYLQLVESEMGVDLFDFGVNTHCLAEFVLNKCFISKKDLSNGKESVPVPCVNYYDESLPEFCSYNTRRTPTVGVPLNLDPDFLCGCDCVDDCADKSKCACWRLTMEGARTIGFDGAEVGYAYKRLPEPLPSGIYECNSRCKCKQTCLNRVAQHPLQLKLQVFKTLNRGWGIRALNDVPRGAFLCVYAGNLLTDATANLDGLNEGDEYLAELDYIEVVEQMKEGFEEDIPDEDKRRDKEESGSSRSSRSSSSSDARGRGADSDDDDFRPAERLLPAAVPAYSKRLRKRDKKKKEGEEKEKKDKERSDDCITISDDEELREPARFSAQTGMGAAGFVSKYKSVRAHFGKDEACYIMDAKVQGNIGRYLNHSCTPNVFVQNVFVDTHDPRFPWVAFFALAHIRAGTELTWNYNYDVGSVPGKVLYCHCAAPNCRGRLL